MRRGQNEIVIGRQQRKPVASQQHVRFVKEENRGLPLRDVSHGRRPTWSHEEHPRPEGTRRSCACGNFAQPRGGIATHGRSVRVLKRGCTIGNGGSNGLRHPMDGVEAVGQQEITISGTE